MPRRLTRTTSNAVYRAALHVALGFLFFACSGNSSSDAVTPGIEPGEDPPAVGEPGTFARYPTSPAPGHRVFVPLDSTDTHLVDVEGHIVHTWPSTLQAGHGAYVLDDGTLLRAVKTGNGRPVQLAGGAVQRVALDGTVLWDFRYDGPGVTSHHDLEMLPNGNVLIIAWEEKTEQETLQAGRNPLLIEDLPFRPDHIIEVRQTGPTTGDIVWEWHVWDHLIQDFDPAMDNFGDVAAHPELVDINFPIERPPAGDWNHCNTVKYDPVHDVIVISARAQDELWIIDHSTTTAEAAGHTGGRFGKGGDLLYRWGNPVAYRAGGYGDQQLFGQHGTRVIAEGLPGAGNILMFNNEHPMGTAVWEIVPPRAPNGEFTIDPVTGRFGPEAPVWRYSAPDIDSFIVSNAERLPNGNTLVCSGFQGYLFEVSPRGDRVWDYATGHRIVFQSHYVDRELWSSRSDIPLSPGERVEFDVIAGTRYAGAEYMVLGSMSGTSPGTSLGEFELPLVEDAYYNSTLTTQAPIGAATGRLDARGRANAVFTLPQGLAPATGATFDHVVIVFDVPGEYPAFVSNVVSFTVTP